jgi:hypothetical protein
MTTFPLRRSGGDDEDRAGEGRAVEGRAGEAPEPAAGQDRRGFIGWVARAGFVTIGAVSGVGALQTAAEASHGTRPFFQLPFGCGIAVRMETGPTHCSLGGNAPPTGGCSAISGCSCPQRRYRAVDMFPSGGAGTPVRPAVGGTLSRAGGSSTNTVFVKHSANWRTMYAHMTNLAPSGKVTRSTTIGKVGAVGTGSAHLHYEQQYYHDGKWKLAYPHFNGKTYTLSKGGDAWSVNRVSHSCLRPKPTWWCQYRVTERHYKRSWAGTKYESEGSVQAVGTLVWAGVNHLSASGTWRRARNSGGADKRGNWVIKKYLARTSTSCFCDDGPCPS